jgi:xanthine dehydrogenase accessory factor
MALLEALRSNAFYVGALGSSRNQTKRRERLLSFDLTEADVDRLHGPVGLQIGSRTPAEIAVAVAAQLVQERRVFEDARVGGLDTPPAGTTAP